MGRMINPRTGQKFGRQAKIRQLEGQVQALTAELQGAVKLLAHVVWMQPDHTLTVTREDMISFDTGLVLEQSVTHDGDVVFSVKGADNE